MTARLSKTFSIPALCAALVVITFAVFGQTLRHGFVDYDDGYYVYENQVVTQGLTANGIAWIFTHADCDLYHPLTMLSFMADDQFHGLHAGWYHLTNLLLHTAAVVLLFLVLRSMTGALWRSAFVAAVFAVHPLRVESVAWIAERKDVLSAFFFMLTLAAYVRYVRKPDSWGRGLMVVAAFVPALLSKPTVVTLPFVLLLLDYWPLRRTEPVRRLVMEKLPLLALSIGAGVMTILAAGKAVAAHANVSMASRLGNAVVSYAVYLDQMFWPQGLAPFYPRPEKGYPVWALAGSLFLLALITGLAAAWRRRHPWLLTGWLWYLGMLFPMIGLVQVGAFAHADRLTYLPQIGICIAAAWLVGEWHIHRAVLGTFATAVLAVLMFCAWKQATYWQDSETLWTRALACTKDNYVAECNMANDLRDGGKVDEAIPHYQQALQMAPDYAPASYNLGNAFYDKGQFDKAIARYQEALRLQPDYAEAHYNLGTALYAEGRLNEAIASFQRALQLRPHNEETQNNLGSALLQKGNPDEAIPHFLEALKIKPGAVSPQINLGLAYFRKGDREEAIAHYQEALKIKPGDREILNKLNDAMAMGHPEKK